MAIKGAEIERYWTKPPPEPSPRIARWVAKVRSGWRPNSRIRGMGYEEASEFYGVYIWEYFNVIQPLLKAAYESDRVRTGVS